MNRSKSKIEIELMLADFHEIVADQPPLAAQWMQELLLDEATCRARVEALIRTASANLSGAEGTTPASDDEKIPPAPDDLLDASQKLGRMGALGAYREGSVTPEDLARVAHDPGALWQSHRGFMQALSDETESAGEATNLTDEQEWGPLATGRFRRGGGSDG